MWDERGPSAAGAAEAVAFAASREIQGRRAAEAGGGGAQGAGDEAGGVSDGGKRAGTDGTGLPHYGGWRSDRCRRIDLLVQLASALELAREFEEAIGLRERIRALALPLLHRAPEGVDAVASGHDVRVVSAGEEMQGRLMAEEDAEVQAVVEGSDAGVERSSALLVEQALSGLSPEEWRAREQRLEADRLHRQRIAHKDAVEKQRASELAALRARGGRVVEFQMEGGGCVRIVMEGDAVLSDWDQQLLQMPLADKYRRRQRRIEADRCYEGARNALEKRPPAVEQAKFLFERAREGYADLGVFDMIEPLKFLERNILRIDRAEPLLTYVPLPAPTGNGTAISPGKLRKYSELSEAYLDDCESRAYDGEGEREEEEDVWQPLVANARPQSRQHRGSVYV